MLGHLDAAIAGLQLGAMATVLVGRLESDGGSSGGMLLRWASAGHLPPVVVDPDGEQRLLAAARPGLLLGVDASATRTEQADALRPGSTVLLYTDGLVERRGQGFDDGVTLLGEAVAALRELPVGPMCDALLARLLPERSMDDVALVAVRLRD